MLKIIMMQKLKELILHQSQFKVQIQVRISMLIEVGKEGFDGGN
jgi:hypothetical protein